MATLCSFCAANYVMRTRNAQAIKGEKNTFDEHEMKEISVYISFALWSYHTSILLFRFRNFQHTLHNHPHLTYIHTYTHTQNYTRSTHYQWIFYIVRRIWFYFVFHCAWMALLFSYRIRKCLRQHFLDLQRNFVNITFRIYIKLSPFLTELHTPTI